MTGQLNGARILITREKRQAEKLANLVACHGGDPVVAPLLTISSKRGDKQQEIVQHLSSYPWIFFTSVNGVHCFFRILQEYGLPVSMLSACQLAVVGSKTAAALGVYEYTADFIPSTYNADVMAEEFLDRFPTTGPILLVRGSMSRSVLPEELTKNEIPYETIEVYETLFNYDMKVRVNELIRDKAFDIMTFTSPSTVQAFVAMMEPNFIQIIQNIPIACIGTTTEQIVRSVGFSNTTITPDVFTIEQMVSKMNDYIAKKG